MRILLLFGVSLFSPLSAMADKDPVKGFWWTDDQEAIVEIFQDEDGLAGRIVWLQEPVYPEDHEQAGELILDEENPESELRSRPVLGLRILDGFERHQKGDWRDGEIYDPENGRTYRARLQIADEGDRLDLRGYVGRPIFGRTTRWDRYDAEDFSEGLPLFDLPGVESGDKAEQ